LQLAECDGHNGRVVPNVKTSKRTSMSADHKAALAKGREEGRIVRRYLVALEEQRPRRGRKRSLESMKKRLVAIDQQINDADPFTRLHLLQEREDLDAELARDHASDNLVAAEKAFVKVAKAYGRRKGIGYAAWRQVGVSAVVLEKAGISRSAKA
jgi:hypothetical protein